MPVGFIYQFYKDVYLSKTNNDTNKGSNDLIKNIDNQNQNHNILVNENILVNDKIYNKRLEKVDKSINFDKNEITFCERLGKISNLIEQTDIIYV